MFGGNFGGPTRLNRVDLSTATSTSSSDLLSSVRAERQAREEKKRRDQAALVIQRVWRGRSEARRLGQELLRRLQRGEVRELEERGRRLVLLGRLLGRDERVEAILEVWVQEASGVDFGESGAEESE
jgi:ubiquitin-protein ligase E3 C